MELRPKPYKIIRPQPMKRATAEMRRHFEDLPKDAKTYLVLGNPFGGPYNGKDAHGEFFFEGTDIRLNIGDEVPLTFDHGFSPEDPRVIQPIPEYIGAALYVGQAVLDREHTGYWYLARLDPQAKLSKLIAEAETSELRASTGTVRHLSRMQSNGAIRVYPVSELAIFPATEERKPANDFAIVLDMADADAVIAELPEDAQAVIAQAFTVARETEEATPTKNAMEVEKMDDEILAKLEEGLGAILDKKLGTLKFDEDALAEKILSKLTPVNQSGKSLSPEPEGDLEQAADAKAVFNEWAISGRFPASMKALTETGDGAALVPTEYADEIIRRIGERSIFTRYNLYARRPVTSRISVWPRMAYSGRASTFTSPNAIAEHNITSDSITATLANIGYLTLVEQALVQDNPRVWSDVVLPDAANAFASAENYYLTVGTGSGEPQGIVTATTQTADLASATAIDPDDILNLVFNVLPTDYAVNSVFMMHPSTAYEVSRMKDSTGRPLWQPSLQDGMPPLLLGRPVYLNSHMPKLSDGAGAKVIVLYDPAFYYFFPHPSILAMRLNEHYITQGFIGYLTIVRYDARLMNEDAAAALTVPA